MLGLETGEGLVAELWGGTRPAPALNEPMERWGVRAGRCPHPGEQQAGAGRGQNGGVGVRLD